MTNIRTETRPDGLWLVCDRGAVAKMEAGYGQTRIDDAAEIVRAVNSHEDLVDALSRCVEVLGHNFNDGRAVGPLERGRNILAKLSEARATA